MPPPPYTYKTWPESFDESLYGVPRPIPGIITAEFDRRSALIAQLKEKHGIIDETRFPGSNNPSAEATAFVLFFVTFSQIIGQEWTSLEERHPAMFGNILDRAGYAESIISGTSASEGPWMPKVNPPWMAGDNNFSSLHSNFRPQEKVEVVVQNEDQIDTCCDQDCTNICTNIGQALDPSNYNPWAAVKTVSNDRAETLDSRETTNQNPFQRSDFETYGVQVQQNEVETTPKSPMCEETENEIVKARAVAVAQIDLGYNTLRMMRMRKLPTESITYKALIEACGRCGISHRATKLMEMMTQDVSSHSLAMSRFVLRTINSLFFCFFHIFL